MGCKVTLQIESRYGAMSLSENLKRLRRIKGYSQNDLAIHSGLRTASISQLEKGDGDPKLSTIYKLMDALECSADALLIEQDKMTLDIKMAIALERTKDLPENAKKNVIDLIDRYCMSYGMEKLIKGSEDFVWPLKGMMKWMGETKPMINLEDNKDEK